MGLRGLAIGLVMVLVARLATAQSGCSTALTSMAPCLNYITGNSSIPSSSCCSQLANVVQSSPQCLCTLLNAGGSSSNSFGLNINQTLALSLPKACNVQTPPVSQCNAANGPTSSAESPAAASDIPSGAGSGSKTIPSDGTNSSAANPLKISLQFLPFLLFLASSVAKF